MAAASRNGNVRYEALFSEFGGRFFLSGSRLKDAAPCFKQARFFYPHWGALAKVRHIEEIHGSLLKPSAWLLTRPHRAVSAAPVSDCVVFSFGICEN